jgi:hypothetical protein
VYYPAIEVSVERGLEGSGRACVGNPAGSTSITMNFA